MTLQKALIMAILFVLVGLFVWKKEQEVNLQAASSQAAAEQKLFPEVTAARVQRVSLVEGGASVSFERPGYKAKEAAEDEASLGWFAETETTSKWHLRRPYGALVDEAKAEQVISWIEKLTAKNHLETSEQSADMSLYGLLPPAMILSIEGDFGKRVASFGKKVELSARRYLQVDGEPRIFLVDDWFFTQFQNAKENIRDRQPIKFDTKRVKEITALRGDTLLRFEHKQGKHWNFSYPGGQFAADGEEVQRFLQALAAIRVKNFIDEPGETLAFYGLKNPKLILTLRLAPSSQGAETSGTEEKDLMIQFGEGVDLDLLAKRSPAANLQKDPTEAVALKEGIGYFFKIRGKPFIYQYSRPVYAKLFLTPDSFRPHSPFAEVDETRVRKVEVSTRNTAKQVSSWAISREGETLQRLSGTDGVKSQPDKVKWLKWIGRLNEFRVLGYLAYNEAELSKQGLNEPRLHIRLTQADATVLQLSVGEKIEAEAPLKKGESSKGKFPDEQAPRHALVQFADGSRVLALVNGEMAEELQRMTDELQ